MGHVVKIVLLSVLAGAGPALAKLVEIDPSLGWLVTVLTPVIAVIVSYLQDPKTSRSRPGPPVLGVLCLLLVGCLAPRTPQQQAADAAALDECVQKHWGESPLQLAGDCANGEIAIIEDVIADIESVVVKQTGGVPASFPYQNNANIMAKLAAKR